MRPRHRFDGINDEAISAIAALFQTQAQRQPFDLPNDSAGVWEVTYRGRSGNLRLLLWPSIDRLDVAVGPHLWVVKGVREVEVIDDLEVIARFGRDGVLTVARNGQIALTTPND